MFLFCLVLSSSFVVILGTEKEKSRHRLVVFTRRDGVEGASIPSTSKAVSQRKKGFLFTLNVQTFVDRNFRGFRGFWSNPRKTKNIKTDHIFKIFMAMEKFFFTLFYYKMQ